MPPGSIVSKSSPRQLSDYSASFSGLSRARVRSEIVTIGKPQRQISQSGCGHGGARPWLLCRRPKNPSTATISGQQRLLLADDQSQPRRQCCGYCKDSGHGEQSQDKRAGRILDQADHEGAEEAAERADRRDEGEPAGEAAFGQE